LPKCTKSSLGHASIAITLDIYSHVLPDMQQDAAQAMTAWFNARGASEGTMSAVQRRGK
jgi:hypothetical protein